MITSTVHVFVVQYVAECRNVGSAPCCFTNSTNQQTLMVCAPSVHSSDRAHMSYTMYTLTVADFWCATFCLLCLSLDGTHVSDQWRSYVMIWYDMTCMTPLVSLYILILNSISINFLFFDQRWSPVYRRRLRACMCHQRWSPVYRRDFMCVSALQLCPSCFTYTYRWDTSYTIHHPFIIEFVCPPPYLSKHTFTHILTLLTEMSTLFLSLSMYTYTAFPFYLTVYIFFSVYI